jgi:hypothetical protein
MKYSNQIFDASVLHAIYTPDVLYSSVKMQGRWMDSLDEASCEVLQELLWENRSKNVTIRL